MITKSETPISFRTSASTDAIIDEILAQNPALEGNRSAAIRKALYDGQDRHAPDLPAPTEEDTMRHEDAMAQELDEVVTATMISVSKDNGLGFTQRGFEDAVREELKARGWNADDVAAALDDPEFPQLT